MFNSDLIVKSLLEDEDDVDPKRFVQRHSKKLYRRIVLFQGINASEMLGTVDEFGINEALIRMAEDHDTGEGETTDEMPWWLSEGNVQWGEFDGTMYALAISRNPDYIGLCAVEDTI